MSDAGWELVSEASDAAALAHEERRRRVAAAVAEAIRKREAGPGAASAESRMSQVSQRAAPAESRMSQVSRRVASADPRLQGRVQRLQLKLAQRRADSAAAARRRLQPRQRWSQEEWLAFKREVENRQKWIPVLPRHLQYKRWQVEQGLLPEWRFLALAQESMWSEAAATRKLFLHGIQTALAPTGNRFCFLGLKGVGRTACVSRQYYRWAHSDHHSHP